jgi:hypothetical protein
MPRRTWSGRWSAIPSAGHRDPTEQWSAPWWARAPTRLILLLIVLAVVAAFGAHKVFTAGTGRTAAACYPTGRPLPRWSLAKTQQMVAATRVRYLVGAGRVDVEGPQDPMAAWSDQVPSSASSRDPFLVPALAGYEIRWWSPEGVHEAADLFVFRTAGDAARYVRLTTTPRCRAAGTISYPIAAPAGARSLIWDNPLGYLQADVFFSRGSRAYRVSEVPYVPRYEAPGAADGRRVLQTPQQIAAYLASCASSVNRCPFAIRTGSPLVTR